MKIPGRIETAFCRISDFLVDSMQVPVPDPARLLTAKMISHRGIYNNRTVYENTLQAFDQAAGCSFWGIELDLRWSRDLYPVAFHDPDCQRLFGRKISMEALLLPEIAFMFPAVPTLSEVIHRFGGMMHLMVEIKTPLTAVYRQNSILRELFSCLTPVADFHLMSLCPEFFDDISFVPPEAFIPIAQLNAGKISDLVLQKCYGGIAGHYLLITRRIIDRLTRRQVPVGTGFVNSKNCLCREISRGVTWHFSEKAINYESNLIIS
jgi:glycerophosphoryl diester phosphodiesterase